MAAYTNGQQPTERGTFRAFPRLGTFVPRPGTNVPRPGTLIPRRGTIWKHCLLGVFGKKLWEMMINLTPLVIIVEESEYFSIIFPNFFPKHRENSR